MQPKYKDYFGNSSQMQIPTTRIPTAPVSYSDFVKQPATQISPASKNPSIAYATPYETPLQEGQTPIQDGSGQLYAPYLKGTPQSIPSKPSILGGAVVGEYVPQKAWLKDIDMHASPYGYGELKNLSFELGNPDGKSYVSNGNDSPFQIKTQETATPSIGVGSKETGSGTGSGAGSNTGGTIVFNTSTGETSYVPPVVEEDGGEGTGGEGTGGEGTGGEGGEGGEGVDPNKVTLDQFYKKVYEMGLANAEKAKEQAMVQSQAQYNEYINPYGTIASQQAAQGLTNGGYSKYLQGQAYQGMLNTQNQARSDYNAATQNLYSDYLGKMVAYNQAKIDKADAGKAAKAELLNNISGYTSQEALGAALDALGITDATERQTYIDAWTKWKTENDAKVQADNNLTMQAVIDGTADVEPTEDNIQAVGTKLGLSQEEIESWKAKLRNKQYAENINPNGDWGAEDWETFFGDARYETLSPEQKETAKEEYSSLFDAATYFEEDGKPLNKNTAKEELDNAVNDNYLTQETKDAIQAQYDKQYNKGIPSTQTEIITKARELNPDVVIDDDAKIVDTNSGTFEITDFGKFNDSGTGKGEQDTYLNAILADLDTHIIAGDLVWVNYGKYDMGVQSLYMYIGDGKFVQVNGTVNIQNMDKIKLPSNGEYKMNKDHTDVIKFGRVTKKKK